MKWIVALATLLLILAFSVGSTTASTRKTSAELEIVVKKCKHARKAVVYYRQVTHKWQRARQSRQLASGYRVRGRDCDYARQSAKEWQARARSARKSHVRWVKEQARIKRQQATRRARRLYEKWECIHKHEGAWNAINPAGYYGGLQMDVSFQRAYGPEHYRRWGTAEKWPVWAQIEAAERAYRVRGFTPWPNTARMCGLL